MTAKRRAKGSGSMYVLKDGTVVGRYEAETPNGETKRKYIRGKSKREVAAKLAKAIAERDAGIVADSEGLTVERYMERWLEAIRSNVRPGTFKPYEAITRLHINPTLGNTKLEKLNALQLETLYRSKLKSGLSPRRVRYIHVTIRKALKDAVRLQLLTRNVADAAIPPRQVKSEIEPLTQDEMRTLLDASRGDRLHALYMLAVTTGMRQGELIGLMWKDVDLDGGTLRVNRSVYEGVISPPKTNAGRRTIRLSKLAVSALRSHRIDAATRSERISEWVFPNASGTPIGHQNLHNRSWKPLLRKAGLPHAVRFHDLRHSCISLLLAKGVPVKVVSEMAGHADISVTLSVYGHVLPDMQGTAADGMDEALG